MTKQELYKALDDAGVKLPEYRRITQAALEETYATQFGKVPEEKQPDPVANAADDEPNAHKLRNDEPPPEVPVRTGTPPALVFEHAGWCEALGCSYFMGIYQPRDWGEYNALKPFAKDGAK